LDSLVGQTLQDWTAFLVDDGSSDEGPALAASRDPRIHLLSPGRVGLVGALNVGVRAARSSGARYIARFDADDVCRPERFQRQVAFLDSHDVDVLDSRFEALTVGPVPRGFLRYRAWHDGIRKHEDFERELLVESPVCHPAVMLRVSSLPDEPLYRDGEFPEDYDLWLRLVRRGLRFHKLEERLLEWREHPGRTTRHDDRYRREGFFAVKWAHAEATFLRDRPRLVVWGARRGGKPWIRALAGHDLVGVVDIDPRVIGGTRGGVAVVGPEALPALHPDVVLLAVGAAGARREIEGRLRDLGLRGIAVAGLAG
jgi:glycosyltransferase involved in cell wall biosynthesis